MLVEAMMELLSSHRHLAELLEETIRRQDDLIYELRVMVGKTQSASTPPAEPSRRQPRRIASRTALPAQCEICRSSTLADHQDPVDESAPPRFIDAEWGGYPLWSGYRSTRLRPIYRNRLTDQDPD